MIQRENGNSALYEQNFNYKILMKVAKILKMD